MALRMIQENITPRLLADIVNFPELWDRACDLTGFALDERCDAFFEAQKIPGSPTATLTDVMSLTGEDNLMYEPDEVLLELRPCPEPDYVQIGAQYPLLTFYAVAPQAWHRFVKNGTPPDLLPTYDMLSRAVQAQMEHDKVYGFPQGIRLVHGVLGGVNNGEPTALFLFRPLPEISYLEISQREYQALCQRLNGSDPHNIFEQVGYEARIIPYTNPIQPISFDGLGGEGIAQLEDEPLDDELLGSENILPLA